MKKRVLMIAAIVSGTLVISGCTTNPYTGEREAGKSGIGAGVGSLVGAGIGARRFQVGAAAVKGHIVWHVQHDIVAV